MIMPIYKPVYSPTFEIIETKIIGYATITDNVTIYTDLTGKVQDGYIAQGFNPKKLKDHPPTLVDGKLLIKKYQFMCWEMDNNGNCKCVSMGDNNVCNY